MAEKRIAGGKKPKVVRVRARGWTKAKRKRFLSELAVTCNVRRACRAVKMSPNAAYEERKRDGAFRAGWSAAVAEAYVALEIMMLERQMNGTVKEILRADGSKERITEYSDRVALQLLRLHKDSVVASEEAEEIGGEDDDALTVRLEQKLRGVRRGMGLPEQE